MPEMATLEHITIWYDQFLVIPDYCVSLDLSMQILKSHLNYLNPALILMEVITMADGFNAPGVVKPFGIFSGAAWQPEGKVLHISGQVSEDEHGTIVGVGDIEAQTRQVLDNINRILDSVGGRMADIAKVTVFIKDMTMLDQIHQVRSEYFEPPYPASSLVQVVDLVKPEFLIEIEAVAVIPLHRAKDPGG